ncbi:MAG: DNA-3-methyladenine glycosylase I [Spirochaetaceae bacterium]|jgi:DNA-3-methyladenine glycosylase I|nr:DNA-3-methyladenine glycosylase I [Spirochaetaceae bacterium]
MDTIKAEYNSAEALVRCPWCLGDEEYKRYHDEEWGVPLYDSAALFEFLLLEGAQAGLSWLTILKRRPAYRKAFGTGDTGLLSAEKIARLGTGDIERLMQDTSIIRNRRKIAAFIGNSRAYLAMEEAGHSFSSWLWGAVGGAPIIGRHQTTKTIPVSTPLSQLISRELRAKGFSFAGPVSIYAFMQAVGMVNDHLTTCFRYAELS